MSVLRKYLTQLEKPIDSVTLDDIQDWQYYLVHTEEVEFSAGPNLLVMMIFGGGQEEFGWRGFALPRMEKSLGLWRSNILLGFIWGCWHVPLWFIPGSNQTYMSFTGFHILTIGWSFIFSWIQKISGGILLSGLFVHGLANTISPYFPTIIMEKNIFQNRFWIRAVLTFSIGIIITITRLKNEKRNGHFYRISLQ